MRNVYNVYKDGTELMHHVSAREAAEFVGCAVKYINIYAARGVKVKGVYSIEAVTQHEEREYSTVEAMKKWGVKNYRMWRELNKRYGNTESK